ncbi:pectate lyase-like adhesive domain-containing protein [Lactococcus petauri]|uniref:pectate lyase-like adhesive domain-containing protein n=1 Tax=Lactococcus petauri TaxID=1940789 RepID=UPI00385461EB
MNKKNLIQALGVCALFFAVSSASTEVHANTSTQEISQTSLKIPKINVEVNTWDQFKSAIEDEQVTDVTLNNNITLESKLYVKGAIKNIHGSGNTIDANRKQVEISTVGTLALMEEVSILNTDIYGLLWSLAQNVEVTYRNVTHLGNQLIYLPNKVYFTTPGIFTHNEDNSIKIKWTNTGQNILGFSDTNLNFSGNIYQNILP